MNQNTPSARIHSSTTIDPVLPWILRTGVAMCFLGHGAFGLMTKQAWVPYFAVVGIPETTAWRLMPWVGAMDVAIAFFAFLWPCRAVFLWASSWAIWTAMLRPLAGQGWPEFLERAGNYGVPLAILAIVGTGPLFKRLPEIWVVDQPARERGMRVLRLATFTLLLGHAACALVLNKASLAHHYAALGLSNPAEVMRTVGKAEVVLAIAALVARSRNVFLGICIWKLVTEGLFLTSGTPAPLFEVIERGGSYVVPLAMVWLVRPASEESTANVTQPMAAPPAP